MIRTLRFLRSPWGWFCACLIAGMSLSLTRGLDNWWDLLNYHVYNPWALLHHRAGVDLFPAGIQGYFDPLLDIPYYLIAFVWFPDHPAIVAALSGLPYGLLLFVTLLLVRNVMAALTDGMSPKARLAIMFMTLVMAVSGVSTWSQAFTTTNEVLVSAIVLGALGLLVGPFADTTDFRRLSAPRALGVGCLLGLAAGLKLTATVYAPAGGLLLLAACGNWKWAIRNGVVFFAGWMSTFAVVFGPWAMHLYEQTGNPLFPMFNNLFHSPLGTAMVGRDARFLPASPWEWLFAPFYWLNDQVQTVYPLLFRDARFALVYVLGIPAAFAALLASRKPARTRSPALFALTAFWFIGYATWLVLFSMLRYAIVLEVCASVIAVGSLLYLTRRFAPRRTQAAHVGLTGMLVLATMLFAQTPDLGRIPIRSHTFQAQVPPLGDRALVILANQPMGLLAPLIEQADPGTTFIGIPACFAQNQWCYAGFYHYALGRRMRSKIATHQGPIYVAYYADHMPVLPQLGTFHISMNGNACRIMHTNRTANVMLCHASYVPGLPENSQASLRFKLSVQTKLLDSKFSLESTWLQNSCGETVNPAKLAFDWHAPASAKRVQVFVLAPPSFRRKPFTAGETVGHAETGPWVDATQTFVFTDYSGRELARSSIHFAACPNN